MMLHRTAPLGVTLALLALLSACGSSGSQSTTQASGPSASATTSAPTKPSHQGGGNGNNNQSSPSNPPATEFNPPGDIPDNQVFVPYHVPGSNVRIKVPEGWARSTDAGTTTFTDHYNSVAIQVVPSPKAPTVKSAKTNEVPALKKTVSNFSLSGVETVQRQGGQAVLVTYGFASAPDKVTGKVVRDAAERFEFWNKGQEAILTLTGPKNADNVDPWQIVS